MYLLRKLIVSAAPTCTLWREDFRSSQLRFVFWPKWTITRREMIDGPVKPAPIRIRINSWVKAKAAAILQRCVIAELIAAGHKPDTAKRIVSREIDILAKDALRAFSFEKSEQDILEARLNRRFDLGSALNESANRAIAAKKEMRAMSVPQSAALEFQKRYLERIVKNS